jgi:predicted phage tail protein
VPGPAVATAPKSGQSPWPGGTRQRLTSGPRSAELSTAVTEIAAGGKGPRTAQDVYDELRGTGPAEPGQFTLDPHQAKEQLRSFLLPDPYAYVLLLVRAAVRRSCTRIDFTFSSHGMTMHFDGNPFPRSDLERLYEAPFDRALAEASPGLHELALGAAVIAKQWFGCTVASAASGGDGARLTLSRDGDDRVESAGNLPPGTRIVVTGKVGRYELVPASSARRPEEHYVRERCRFASVEVRIDGRNIAAELSATADAVWVEPFSAKGIAGEAGFLPLERVQGSVRFVLDGVVVGDENLAGAEGGFTAVVHPGTRAGTDGLLLDASQNRVVQNEFYRRTMEAAAAAWERGRAKGSRAKCRWAIDERAREELSALQRKTKSRVRVFIVCCGAAGWLLSGLVAAFFVGGATLWERVEMAAAVATYMAGLGTAMLLALVTHIWLLTNPARREFERRFPDGSPLRMRMQEEDLRSELQKALPRSVGEVPWSQTH